MYIIYINSINGIVGVELTTNQLRAKQVGKQIHYFNGASLINYHRMCIILMNNTTYDRLVTSTMRYYTNYEAIFFLILEHKLACL